MFLIFASKRYKIQDQNLNAVQYVEFVSQFGHKTTISGYTHDGAH